jgi:uncharacterized membrane protein YbhN (UPF0104 family)
VKGRGGSVWKSRVLPIALLLGGLAILAATAGRVDLAQAARALGRIGFIGAAAFLVNIVLTIVGPFVGWHVLLRSLGVPVRLRTTIASGLLGRAVNLFSPFNYFGGESIRTLHVAAATKAPRRKVLAALVVSEFQVMAGLTVFALAGLAIWSASGVLAGARLSWAAAGAGALALVLVGLLGLALGDVRPCLRVLETLIRWGIFPKRLSELRAATLDLETLIRSLFVERPAAFYLSQALSLSSPVAQFLRPTLFFWLLARTDPSIHLPGFLELTVFFVLTQLVFMLPTTPGGVGVYEAGVIGAFRLLGWDPALGAAYGVLLRLDDVLFIVASISAVGAGTFGAPGEPDPDELERSGAAAGGRAP